MMTAFAAMGALLIGLANSSTTVEKVLTIRAPDSQLLKRSTLNPEIYWTRQKKKRCQRGTNQRRT
jgi:hypothetical protein